MNDTAMATVANPYTWTARFFMLWSESEQYHSRKHGPSWSVLGLCHGPPGTGGRSQHWILQSAFLFLRDNAEIWLKCRCLSAMRLMYCPAVFFFSTCLLCDKSMVPVHQRCVVISRLHLWTWQMWNFIFGSCMSSNLCFSKVELIGSQIAMTCNWAIPSMLIYLPVRLCHTVPVWTQMFLHNLTYNFHNTFIGQFD